MEDEQSELKKPLWPTVLVVLASSLIVQCILNWDAILGQGFKAFQWDNFLAGAFGAFVLIWVMPGGQREGITTLGIGRLAAKKLQ